MSTEALALAVVSIVRPTTAAAVWAMLVGSRPRRLLTVYLIAGLAVSLPVGVAVVLLAGEAFTPRRGADSRGVLLVSLGFAALLAALAVRLGWRQRFRPDEPGAAREPRRLTPTAAATAGVVTHLPGVFYLAALGAIAGTGASAGNAVLQVVVYNAVWFAPAIVALGLCLFGAVPSADRLAGPLAWARARRHDPHGELRGGRRVAGGQGSVRPALRRPGPAFRFGRPPGRGRRPGGRRAAR